MISVALSVNGCAVKAQVEPRLHLGDFIREHLRLTGTHLACEHGVCGACTVLVNGLPMRSCITLAARWDGADVRTIEGFDDDPTMGRLREAFSREHGLQCGFCTPGMLIASRDIVLRLPDADENRIRDELSGNLCRCTGYLGIVRAVRSVLEMGRDMREQGAPEDLVAPQTMKRFSPKHVAPAYGAPPLTDEPADKTGWTTFTDEIVIAADPDMTWTTLNDFTTVASCLPGARLTHQDAETAKGTLAIRLGPIAATFAGSAAVERDNHARIGRVRGAGNDGASRSSTRGELTYRVAPNNETGSRVFIDVKYSLRGPLAQFSRSGIAREFGRRLLREFAANLNRRLTQEATHGLSSTPAKFAPGGLLWAAFLDWARRAFRSWPI
jgi:carbon-monoxide dehydrogenase small subunit